jgi:regulator of protease activity HflC (stomatin/prohibitin superfamily)
MSDRADKIASAFVGMFIATIVAFSLYWVFVGWAYYRVWSNDMAGRADMAYAEQQRQVKVREAQAFKDSAQLLAEAEVLRATGVAKANEIIAGGLGGPEGYLRYLFIQQLGNADKNERTIVYVPTDGLLPITEAGRVVPRHP